MFTRIKNFFFKKLSQKKSLKPPSQEKKSSKSSFNSLSNSSLKSSPKDSSKESITESSKESSKDSDHTIDESLLLQKLSRMNIENPDNFNTLFIWSKKIIFEKRMLLNEVYEDYSLFNEIIDIFISFCEKVYFEYIKFNIYLKDHRNSIEREYKVLFGSKLLLGIIYILFFSFEFSHDYSNYNVENIFDKNDIKKIYKYLFFVLYRIRFLEIKN